MIEKMLKENYLKAVKEQLELYVKLKKTVGEENKALKIKNLKNIEKLIQEEDEYVTRIKEMEMQKYDLFLKMAEGLGLKNDGSVKLNELLEKMETDEANEIGTAVLGLLEMAKEVDTINIANAHLLKNFTEYVNYVQTKTNIDPTKLGGTYTQTGTPLKTEPVKKTNFDSKI